MGREFADTKTSSVTRANVLTRRRTTLHSLLACENRNATASIHVFINGPKGSFPCIRHFGARPPCMHATLRLFGVISWLLGT